MADASVTAAKVRKAPTRAAAKSTAAPVESTAASEVIADQTPTIEKAAKMAASTFGNYEELASFGKANIDALVQANTVFVKGIEELSREFFGLTQASFESAAAATTAMLAAKSLKDVVELNADFTKSQYEKLVANTTKFSELGAKLASETAAPLAARANHVVSTVTHTA
jgi:phasin family protein